MRTRYTVNESGELVSRDGAVLGKITSITVEAPSAKPANSDPLGGTLGGASVEDYSTTTKENPQTPADRVWAHYVNLFGTGYTLNPARKRIIKNALAVRPEERCIRAVSGLHTSPHHNGDNEQKIKYLDIRYALKGNSRTGESVEERIDRMAGLADQRAEAVSSSPIPIGYSPLVEANLRSTLRELRLKVAEGDSERVAWLLEHGLPSAFRFEHGADGWRVVEAKS